MTVEVPSLPTDVPTGWRTVEFAGQQASTVDLQRWWKQFKDPVLDALVDEALSSNPDLEQAALRLRSEQILASRWHAAYLPGLEGKVRTLQDVAAADTYFHASIGMSWELGLFGAMESARLKARANVDHAQAHQHAARVALVAGVVRNYLDMGVARQQLQALKQLQRIDREAHALALVREHNHLGLKADVDQAHARELRTQAEIAAMQELADRAGRALAVLLGRIEVAGEWARIQAPPVLSAFAVSEVPADVLRTRPDVRAAEADVMQAAADLGIARSALYPRLSLGGSLLYSYNITHNMRTSTDSIPALGPVIDIPLWSWGQRRARLRADQKLLDAALVGYRKSVLAGVSETEDALASLARQQERIEALAASRQLQDERVKRDNRLIAIGLFSHYDALDGRRRLLRTTTELALAEGARALAFVALYKALGGAPLAVSPETAP